MTQRFNGKDGKVVYFDIEEVIGNYEEGTLKVEVHIYPIQGSKFSSFIYTKESMEKIQDTLPTIAEIFLSDEKNSYGSKEISDTIGQFLNPIFPQKT